MFLKLLLLFITVPFVEVFILVKMAMTIGFWPTLLIQVVTAVVGASLAKLQGWLIWMKIMNELRQGHIPAEQMVDGLIIFVAGIVLLTPGLLTDLCGVALLMPWPRYWFKRWLRKKFDTMVKPHITQRLHF